MVSVSSVGESLYNFYGYVCDGVYKDFFMMILLNFLSQKISLTRWSLQSYKYSLGRRFEI